MKRFILAGLAALGLAAAATGSAAAQTIQVRWSSSLYAGPSTNYPVVSYLRAGEGVRLNGCLQDYAWCDVSDGANRGWVDADNLSIYRGGSSYTFYEASPWFTYPVTTFLLTDYWRRNYYSRPWYRDYNRYERYDWRNSNRPWTHRPPPPGYRPPVNGPGRPPMDHRPGVRPPYDNRPNPNWRPNDRPGQGVRPPYDNRPNPGWRPNDRPGQSVRPPDSGQPNPGNRPPPPRPGVGPGDHRPPPANRPGGRPEQGPRGQGPRPSPSNRPAQQER